MKLFLVILSMLLNALTAFGSEDVTVDTQRLDARKKFTGPRLFVDTDFSKPGVQPRLRIAHGSRFTVDIVITNLDRPLGIYEVTLNFNPEILKAIDVESGGFIPGGGILVKGLTPALEVYWAEGVISSGGGFGDGVLATIMFEAIGSGRSKLDISSVILVAADTEIPVMISNGEVRVPRSRGR